MISSNLNYADKSKVKWKSGKCFRVQRENKRYVFKLINLTSNFYLIDVFFYFRCIYIKKEFWEPFRTVILQKSFKKNVVLKNLYDSRLPISQSKFNDLNHFCTSGTVPQKYHRYYQSLIFNDGKGNSL